jgi:hypothetical protein
MLRPPMADQPAKQVYGPIPTVQAILACDGIITDAVTQKKTLVGVFDMINLPAGGGVIPSAHLFARMYDGRGRYIFKIDFVDADQEKMILQAETQPVEIPDPLAGCDIALPLPPLAISGPGRYEFRLYANQAYIAHLGIRAVRQTQEQK